MDEETYRAFEKLSQDEFDLIFSRLLGYTINLVDRYHWRYGVMPAGVDPKDIVQRIITKTLQGKLNWDPNKTDLFTFLRGRVWSETGKLFRRKEYLHEQHAHVDEDISDVIDHKLSPEEILERVIYQDPAEWLIEIEDAQEKNFIIQEYIDGLLDASKGKPELEEVVYAILDGCEENPRFLAEWLNIPVSEVNNRIKRLRRRADRIKKKRMTS